MMWVLLVREPPHPDAIGFLRTVDGKPEVIRMCDVDWYVYAKRDCALDINKDARLAMDVGWKYIYIKALKA